MLKGIDRKWRWFPMAVVALTTGLAAAPAQATLFVRSDAAGLAVRDKNNLNDKVTISFTTAFNPTGYSIVNENIFDVFKFDLQAGCSPSSQDESVECVRNGPTIQVGLAGGSDSLIMDRAPVGEATVNAGSGNDNVIGHDGNDEIHGFTGEDNLSGRKGSNTIFGEDQDDILNGGVDSDRLEGGAGADFLNGNIGVDVLLGGSGNDQFQTKEDFLNAGQPAERDSVSCGTGFDTVAADLKDFVVSSCEELVRSPVGEMPHVVLPRKVLDVSRSGVARPRLRCPAKTTIGCRGKLSLRLAKRGTKRPAQTRYKIAAGKSRSVRVRLTAGESRRVRGRLRGILKSVEKGHIGPKTTIRQPRLR